MKHLFVHNKQNDTKLHQNHQIMVTRNIFDTHYLVEVIETCKWDDWQPTIVVFVVLISLNSGLKFIIKSWKFKGGVAQPNNLNLFTFKSRFLTSTLPVIFFTDCKTSLRLTNLQPCSTSKWQLLSLQLRWRWWVCPLVTPNPWRRCQRVRSHLPWFMGIYRAHPPDAT